MLKFMKVVIKLAMAAAGTSMAFAAGAQTNPPLVLSEQGSFFVGGRDIQSDALSTIPNFSPEGTISIDQVYVHFQIPAARHGNIPLVLIHGCCLTGKTWETTPDGRMGWDEFFLRKGHPVYVIDQAWRGRSAGSPVPVNNVKAGKAPADTLPVLISAGRESAWEIFRFGPKYPEVFKNMQFPLAAQTEFWKQMVPDWTYGMATPNPTVPALSELARKVGGAVLISHSQSGIYPFQTAALDARGISAIVSIEPGACPRPDIDMTPLKNIPSLILFGDFIELSPAWSKRLEGCQAFVKSAVAAGVPVELVQLPKVGIKGNSHMMMQDKNSLVVADWLNTWISRHVHE
jgi:pimeloyl-ACP methyl ester carboxylesterase